MRVAMRVVEELQVEAEPGLRIDPDEVAGEHSARFVELLTAHQPKLYGYIATMLMGDSAGGRRVAGNQSRPLGARWMTTTSSVPFLPWAFGFARQKVLVFRRNHCRSRLLFGDEALSLIDEACMELANKADDRLVALRKCLQKLNPEQVALIHAAVRARTPVKLMAEHLGQAVQNISSRLHRIRKALAKCIEATIAAEGR